MATAHLRRRPSLSTAPVAVPAAAAAAAAAHHVTTTALSSPKPSDLHNLDLDLDFDGIDAPLPPRSPPPPVPSILQPRVAVVLNVPKQWHPWLFFLRLCSILPASWWGLPSLLRLLLHFLPGPPDQFLLVRPCTSVVLNTLASTSAPEAAMQCAVDHNGVTTAVVAAPYALTETTLATIWCFACGYLSFFFTDCLMSRWLINYTPQATLVRLLSINAVNAYVTLSVLSLTGGFQDPRLLLPGWVGMATTLTVCYHITHQKINIRKETSTSVNVFSIASYITMVVLLAHMQTYQSDYPTMPVVTRGRYLWQDALNLVARIKVLIHEHAEL
ncbi:hypothetical protein PT974_01308 [Cladobotryum mycophilum]|uniref:N-glycosylation protein EOS1 n=1 Tax=Cladobotryum mycophilum TaxID=491253 RepID=A0ABR0T3C1_9HYPO